MRADHQRLLDVGGLRRPRQPHREPRRRDGDALVGLVQVVHQGVGANDDGQVLGEEGRRSSRRRSPPLRARPAARRSRRRRGRADRARNRGRRRLWRRPAPARRPCAQRHTREWTPARPRAVPRRTRTGHPPPPRSSRSARGGPDTAPPRAFRRPAAERRRGLRRAKRAGSHRARTRLLHCSRKLWRGIGGRSRCRVHGFGTYGAKMRSSFPNRR